MVTGPWPTISCRDLLDDILGPHGVLTQVLEVDHLRWDSLLCLLCAEHVSIALLDVGEWVIVGLWLP